MKPSEMVARAFEAVDRWKKVGIDLDRQRFAHKRVGGSQRPAELLATSSDCLDPVNSCGSYLRKAQKRWPAPLLSLIMLMLILTTSQQQCECLSERNQQQIEASAISQKAPLIMLEPVSSIFGSLLGSGGNSGSSHQQLQQAAADLHQSYKNGQTSDKVTLPGDILLGGLFPIHMKGTKIECGEINRDRGIQRLEAMLYALDRINEDSQLLPDIKLGAILLDSCSSSTYALNQSLEFIRASINTVESSAFECKDKSTPRPKYGSKMIAGVVGGSYSEVSLQVANLLRLFRIPQVSYASTGTALSDKTLYDLFARTVPSDMFQARAIADIVLKLNWTYVSLVSSEGLYGDSGSKEFMKQASVRRICIATHEKISPTTDELAYDSIVASLLKRNATGVVLFTRAEDTRELLLAVKRAKLSHNFAWVAADGWGTHQKLVEGVEEVAWGAITVELQAKAIPGFDQYMKALTPWGNARNPWFSEYWQEWFDCQLQANLLQQQQVASGAYMSRRDHSSLSASVWAPELSEKGPEESGAANRSPEDYVDDSTSARKKRRRSLGDTRGNCSMVLPTTATATTTSEQSSEERESYHSNCSSGGVFTSNHKTATTASPTEGAQLSTSASTLREEKTDKQLARVKREAGNLNQGGNLKQFCSPNLRISESNGYRQEQKVQFVVDAVYAMAHALHKAWFKLCNGQRGQVCEALKELNGGDFYAKYLLNVSFKDLAGSEVKFDERGDGLGRYNIYNFRRLKPQLAAQAHSSEQQLDQANRLLASNGDSSSFVESPLLSGADLNELSGGGGGNGGGTNGLPVDETGGDSLAAEPQITTTSGNLGPPINDPQEHIYTSNVEYEYSSIGRWTENDYYLRLDDIQFIHGERSIPESFCSRPCELGQAKIMRAGDHCCWICKTCAPFEYLPDEFSCRDCGIGRWPVANKTSCFELPQKYLRWDSVYSLISLTIACLGIGLTMFVSIIFIKYLDTPVVKASGRELSFILLAGIAFCHLSTFVLLSKPTTFICGSQRFLVNFGFSLMYASLLVKTNRISRIFNCARKSAKRPSFISPKSQMLITGILVAIQIFLTIVWFVFEPPGIRADSPEGKRDEVILKCRAKGKSFIISLVYNMILITTCTVYAVKTRKIPENFNESKFIGFTMYTTIVIWLAFVTMFFGTNNSYEIQINTMCVCISLSAYVTLFCLFSPKVSIILLHPDKNVRKLTMNSATYKRPFKPVSSLASADGRGYNTVTGTHADGGSGGPVSSTSNVLNIAESQAARPQESSIASNVVNSNSAGSNCSNSQRTPTTLSQQLTQVGACAHCGAHQLTQVPMVRAIRNPPTSAAGSSLMVNGHQQQQLQAGGDRHTVAVAALEAAKAVGATGRLAASGVGLGGSHLLSTASVSMVPSGRHQESSNKPSVSQPFAATTVSQVRSSSSAAPITTTTTNTTTGPRRIGTQLSGAGGTAAAVAAAAGSGLGALGGGGTVKAKVLHSKIHSSRPDFVKHNSSDAEHLLDSDNRGQTTAPTAAVGNNRKRYMSSLNRLNEMVVGDDHLDSVMNVGRSEQGLGGEAAATLFESGQLVRRTFTTDCQPMSRANESTSSLINEEDSLANFTTSNENTPTNAAGQNQSSKYATGKGSDSMLWNQSVYSIDYCSDCCPSSYCYCSCAACSSTNGADCEQQQQQQQLNPHLEANNGAICLRATHNSRPDHMDDGDELDDYDVMCDSLLIQDQDQDQDQTSHHFNCLATTPSLDNDERSTGIGASSQLIRRRRSEEPRRASECGYHGASVFTHSHDHQDKYQMGAKVLSHVEQRSIKHKCRTIDDGLMSGAQLLAGGSAGKGSRQLQTIEMQTLANELSSASNKNLRQAPFDEQLTLSTSSPQNRQKTQSSVSSAPVVYALQAAAHSALGVSQPTTLSALQQQQQSATNDGRQQQNSRYTSSKDKFSERRTHRLGLTQPEHEENEDQDGALIGGAAAAAKYQQQGRENLHQQSQNKSSSEQQQLASSNLEPQQYQHRPGGTIQTSIEMLKSTSSQKKDYHYKQRKQAQRDGDCFSYQDDQEHSYSLVQCNSDSENNHYYFEDDSTDTAVSSIPRDDFESTQFRDSAAKGAANVADNDDDDDEFGDDFEHDGRVTPSRSNQDKTRSTVDNSQSSGQRSYTTRLGGRNSGAGLSGNQNRSSKELETDERRINSMALIAATLSAGGAIVESGSSVSETMKTQQQQQQQQHQSTPKEHQDSQSSSSRNQPTDDEGEHLTCLTTL